MSKSWLICGWCNEKPHIYDQVILVTHTPQFNLNLFFKKICDNQSCVVCNWSLPTTTPKNDCSTLVAPHVAQELYGFSMDIFRVKDFTYWKMSKLHSIFWAPKSERAIDICWITIHTISQQFQNEIRMLNALNNSNI